MRELVIAATGHRPAKLGARRRLDELPVASVAYAFLATLRPDRVISGMARGWDLIVAEQCLRLKIPLVAAVPGSPHDQTAHWDYSDVSRYQHVLHQAAHVEIIPATVLNTAAYHARDRWMVDHAHMMLAAWNGSGSGTGYTVEYARGRGVAVCNLWDLLR